jgi:ABC-2 type transport system ATP-binding protein
MSARRKSALLEIEHLTKTYRGDVKANDDISLTIAAGQVFGLLGPNGAGKTTLVGQVLGLVAPTSGSIRIDGVDVVRRPSVARTACSYQPQSSVPIDELTPLQALELAGRIRGGRRAEVRARGASLIEALDLGEWQNKAIGLSGGVSRLVAFCMAAVVPGRIVILDEPTNDVDPLRRKFLWKQVRALADDGAAVLLVTHNVLEAERCVDRLAIVDGGRLVGTGTPASMKSNIGNWLHFELVLEPGVVLPSLPRFLERPTTAGRRLIGEVQPASVGRAIGWARRMRDQGVAEEFSLGPATLEDVYVRHVGSNGHVHDKVAAS